MPVPVFIHKRKLLNGRYRFLGIYLGKPTTTYRVWVNNSPDSFKQIKKSRFKF